MCGVVISYSSFAFEKIKAFYLIDDSYQGYITYSRTAWHGRLLSFLDIFKQAGTILWEVLKHGAALCFLVAKAVLGVVLSILPSFIYAVSKLIDHPSQDYWQETTIFLLNSAYTPPEGVVMHFCPLLIEPILAAGRLVCDVMGLFFPEIGRQGRLFNPCE